LKQKKETQNLWVVFTIDKEKLFFVAWSRIIKPAFVVLSAPVVSLISTFRNSFQQPGVRQKSGYLINGCGFFVPPNDKSCKNFLRELSCPSEFIKARLRINNSIADAQLASGGSINYLIFFPLL